ncbi:MAG: AAA family ATPase [Nitrospira sp.]|nr:AAA family ATPase [Nitrospira sp.]
MKISHLTLKNWRNFTRVDVELQERQFIVGPNASGKSNLLDVFRFLRDIANPRGGGLQKAIEDRGGLSKIRCLSARRDPKVEIAISIADSVHDTAKWRYGIGITQETRGHRQPVLSYEQVWDNSAGKWIINRPDKEDLADKERLKQTFLEQINSNQRFRDIAQYLAKTTYLHLVPQLLRYADSFQGRLLRDDPFGQGFLVKVAETSAKSQKSRLSRIEKIIQAAVPKLSQMAFERDEITGRPHIKALHSHWRRNAGWQREDQFSDGTLRLIGFLWSMMESDSLLLLEEPELSLHTEVVRVLSPLIYRVQRQRKRQILISTHSPELLSDRGIDGGEVLVLRPGNEGTEVEVAKDMPAIRSLLESGLSAGEVVIPWTRPKDINQLSLAL